MASTKLVIALGNTIPNKLYLFDPDDNSVAEFSPPYTDAGACNLGPSAVWADSAGHVICTPRQTSDNNRHAYHLEDGAWVDKGVSSFGDAWSYSGPNYSNVWAVNGDGKDVAFWDGSNWVIDAANVSPSRIQYISCCGTGDDEVFVAGRTPKFYHRTSGARGSGVWTDLTAQLWSDIGWTGQHIGGIHAVSKTEVYISIKRWTQSGAYVVKYNGSAFSVEDSFTCTNCVGTPSEANSIGSGSSMSWVASDPSYGNYHVFSFAGGSLSRLLPEPNLLNACTILGDAGSYCVGTVTNSLRVWDFGSGTPTQVAAESISCYSGQRVGLAWYRGPVPGPDFTNPQGGIYNIFAKIDGLEPVLWRHHHLGQPQNWSRSIITCLRAVTEHADSIDLAEMKAGINAMTFRLREVESGGVDYFSQLFAPGRWAEGDVDYLAEGDSPHDQLDADATEIDVQDADNLAATGTVHIGQEAISYTGKSGDQLTGCTRGLYPCVGTNWSFTFARPEEGAPGFTQQVAEYPYTWIGRRIALYCAEYRQDVEDWSDEDNAELLWVGRISNKIVNKGKTGEWVLSAESILTELENRQLGANLPASSLLHAINLRGDRGRWFRIIQYLGGKVCASIDVLLPKNIYTIQMLINFIHAQMGHDDWDWDPNVGQFVYLQFVYHVGEGKVYLRGRLGAEPAADRGAEHRIDLVMRNQFAPESNGQTCCHALQALGFDGHLEVQSGTISNSTDRIVQQDIASGTPYIAYHPLRRECNGSRLYVKDYLQYWADQGDDSSAHANVGIPDAVISKPGDVKGTYFARYTARYGTYFLELDLVHNPDVDESGYVGQRVGEKDVPIRQAWIPRYIQSGDTELGAGPFELLLRPLLSTGTPDYNGTYDKLPLALSAAIQASLVDTDSFLDADRAIAKSDLWHRRFYPIAWDEPITWMDLALRECKLFGYAILWRNSRLTCTPIAKPLIDATVTLTESVRATKDEFPDTDTGVDTVVNQWDCEVDYNPTTGKYGPKWIIRDVNSITGLNVTKATSIKHPGIQITAATPSLEQLLRQTLAIAGLLRMPAGVVRVTLAHTMLKRVWVGDTVVFESTCTPDPFGSGTRTMSCRATVLAVRWSYGEPMWSGSATLLLHTWLQSLGDAWAPAALVDTSVDGGNYDRGYSNADLRLALAANAFGTAGYPHDDPHDGAALAPSGGEVVRVIQRGKASPTVWTVEAASAYGTDGSNILTINEALTGWDGNEAIVECAPVTVATSAQQENATFGANPTTKLLDGGTPDRWG